MHVLVSTSRTQGQRKNDFCWVPEGEMVTFGSECDGEAVDGHCGCRRAMTGMDSMKSTTTFLVEDRPDLTLEGLAELVYASHEKGGCHFGGPEREAENREWALADARDLASLAEAFPVGMIVEKRGTQFQERVEKGA